MRKTRPGKKLNFTPTVAGIGVAYRNKRLCVIDVDSRERFLVDMGADISVLLLVDLHRKKLVDLVTELYVNVNNNCSANE